MAKIFISYRRADPDEGLAGFLQTELARHGHQVFRDVDTPIGKRWAEEIQQAMDTCEYFVILISELSMDRDMVRQEVQKVHHRNRAEGKPAILPVRLGYRGALPYDMAAWLDPLQYAFWEGPADNARLAGLLAGAISGAAALPLQQTRTAQDQRELIELTEESGRPLPKAEPVLDVLGLAANNPFYVEREVDHFFYDSLRLDNGVATLYAPRQMGKSSLIARVRAKLEQEKMKSVFLDLKMLAAESSITDAVSAFEGLGYLITEQLDLPDDPAAFFSRAKGFVGTRLQKFLVQVVSPVADRVVLLFDDIDAVFDKPYRDAFFGSLRAVIDQKGQTPALQKIGFGFALSHDHGLWIKSANQSPFSVAKTFPVVEFTRKEFDWLNRKHGNCLKPAEATLLYDMLGGHPYLTRVAFYRLSKKEITLAAMQEEAATDNGIFGDHLRSRLWIVINAGLSKPFKSILDTGRCDDVLQFQSLLAMGLVKGESHRKARARFGLYGDYFKPRLDA